MTLVPVQVLNETVLQNPRATVHFSAARNKERLFFCRKNASEPLLFIRSVHKNISIDLAFEKNIQATFIICYRGYEEHLIPRGTVLSASCPAWPRLAAQLCAPNNHADGMSGPGYSKLDESCYCISRCDQTFKFNSIRKFLDMPCMKRDYRDKKASSTGRQPGTKSASRHAAKTGCQPLILFLRRFT